LDLSATSGAWDAPIKLELLTWFDYATGTNAVFIPNTAGIGFSGSKALT